MTGPIRPSWNATAAYVNANPLPETIAVRCALGAILRDKSTANDEVALGRFQQIVRIRLMEARLRAGEQRKETK